MLAEEDATRIDGPHCCAFYTGAENFEAMMEAEPGTFFLTDFLARHFDRLVVEGLGLDRFPQLLPDDLEAEAGAAAAGLETEYDQTRLMALARNCGRESPP